MNANFLSFWTSAQIGSALLAIAVGLLIIAWELGDRNDLLRKKLHKK